MKKFFSLGVIKGLLYQFAGTAVGIEFVDNFLSFPNPVSLEHTEIDAAVSMNAAMTTPKLTHGTFRRTSWATPNASCRGACSSAAASERL